MIDIIGAGIGGLTTTIALKQKGFQIRIFEQAEQLKPVGAGIILANNAMQVYEKLGLRKVIEENGNHISSMNITRPNLNPISKMDLTSFEKKFQVKNIAIHRGTLQQILLNELKSDIHLNHQLDTLLRNNNGYSLTFKNGTQIQSSVLIGADGLNSKVRQHLFPNNIVRNAKQICWRGVTDFKLPVKYKNELNEAWGKRGRFGFVQIAENKVYWYALKTIKNNPEELSVNDIGTCFDEFNPIVNEIINSTSKEKINTAEIYDLKPNSHWYKNNVCLLGDAAHATTPNMGQGACQAIEDAFVLSECLRKYDTTVAFEKFQELRLKKAHQVVKASWMIGKISHWSNPISVGIRNKLMQLTPTSINQKQSEQIFKIPIV